MSDPIIELAFLEEDDAEVSVSHPAFGISCQRGAPQRFDIAIHCGLSPRQRRQGGNHNQRRAQNEGAILLEHTGQTKYARSEEHTSELQSQSNLVCRLLLEK